MSKMSVVVSELELLELLESVVLSAIANLLLLDRNRRVSTATRCVDSNDNDDDVVVVVVGSGRFMIYIYIDYYTLVVVCVENVCEYLLAMNSNDDDWSCGDDSQGVERESVCVCVFVQIS
mmetsp:Transcript_19954/g.41772  ORF Transcript_19954/g.41772 Transcript_19954/m.41772 type:complete len:120 (-) Transcript_19954:17-376(-)